MLEGPVVGRVETNADLRKAKQHCTSPMTTTDTNNPTSKVTLIYPEERGSVHGVVRCCPKSRVVAIYNPIRAHEGLPGHLCQLVFLLDGFPTLRAISSSLRMVRRVDPFSASPEKVRWSVPPQSSSPYEQERVRSHSHSGKLVFWKTVKEFSKETYTNCIEVRKKSEPQMCTSSKCKTYFDLFNPMVTFQQN